jgi:hypothetical protein
MVKIYEYLRHPRLDELHARRPLKTSQVRGVDHQNPIVRFNARIGLWITLGVGTMWMAYLFAVLTLFALPDAMQQGTYYVIVWLSSSFLQLVLLPIIIVGQNIQAKAADQRAEEMYENAKAVLKEADEIQQHLLAQDEALANILQRVQLITPAAGPDGATPRDAAPHDGPPTA